MICTAINDPKTLDSLVPVVLKVEHDQAFKKGKNIIMLFMGWFNHAKKKKLNIFASITYTMVKISSTGVTHF